MGTASANVENLNDLAPNYLQDLILALELAWPVQSNHEKQLADVHFREVRRTLAWKNWFSVAALVLWNDVPLEIKFISTLTAFQIISKQMN